MKFLLKLILVTWLIVNWCQVGAEENLQPNLDSQERNSLQEEPGEIQKQGQSSRQFISGLNAVDDRPAAREINLSTEVFIYFLIISIYGMLWYKDYLTVQKKD